MFIHNNDLLKRFGINKLPAHVDQDKLNIILSDLQQLIDLLPTASTYAIINWADVFFY